MKPPIPILVGICCLSLLSSGCSSLAGRDDVDRGVSQEEAEERSPHKPCDTPDCFLHGHHKHPKLFRYQRYRNPHL